MVKDIGVFFEYLVCDCLFSFVGRYIDGRVRRLTVGGRGWGSDLGCRRRGSWEVLRRYGGCIWV